MKEKNAEQIEAGVMRKTLLSGSRMNERNTITRDLLLIIQIPFQ